MDLGEGRSFGGTILTNHMSADDFSPLSHEGIGHHILALNVPPRRSPASSSLRAYNHKARGYLAVKAGIASLDTYTLFIKISSFYIRCCCCETKEFARTIKVGGGRCANVVPSTIPPWDTSHATPSRVWTYKGIRVHPASFSTDFHHLTILLECP